MGVKLGFAIEETNEYIGCSGTKFKGGNEDLCTVQLIIQLRSSLFWDVTRRI